MTKAETIATFCRMGLQIDPSKGPFDDAEVGEDGEQMPSQARQWILPSASLHDVYAL
jgi:hypothetical protein